MSACSITTGSWLAQTTAAPVSRASVRQQRGQAKGVRLVEPRGRLVDEQQRRPRGQRPRDRDALTCSPAESRETRWPARSARPTAASASRASPVEPADRLAELDVLARAQEWDQAALLRHERDLAAAQLGAGRAVERCTARRRRTSTSPAVRQVEPGEQVQERGLARSRTGR